MKTSLKNLAILILGIGLALPGVATAQVEKKDKGESTQKYTAQQASDDNRSGRYADALRKSEHLKPDSIWKKDDITQIRINALLRLDEKRGVELIKSTLKENNDDEQFIANSANEIASAKGLSKSTYLYGVELLEKVNASLPNYEPRYIVYDFISRCYYYAGEQDKAIEFIEKSIEDAKKNKANPESIKYIEGVMEKYKAKAY